MCIRDRYHSVYRSQIVLFSRESLYLKTSWPPLPLGDEFGGFFRINLEFASEGSNRGDRWDEMGPLFMGGIVSLGLPVAFERSESKVALMLFCRC